MPRLQSGNPRPSQFRLLRTRRLAPLWLCQLCNSLANEMLRLAMMVTVGWQMIGPQSAATRGLVVASFVIPALVGAPLGGQLADRFDRRNVLRFTQGLILLAALTGVWGLVSDRQSALLAALAIAGFQTAIFSSTRGAMLRQHLAESELTAGTGLLMAGRQLALLLGTLVALSVAGTIDAAVTVIPWLLSLAGLLAVVAMIWLPASPVPQAGFRFAWSPVRALRNTLMIVLHDRNLFLAVLGVSWFWLTALVYLVYLPDFANEVLGIPRGQTVGLLAVPAAGAIIGALLCYPASGRRIELGLVPLGALGMTVAGVSFYLSAPDAAVSAGSTVREWLGEPAFRRTMVGLLLFGASSALFVVPLRALIISIAPADRIGRVMGGMVLYNLLFVSIALAGADWLHNEGLSVQALVLVVTLMHASVAIYIFLLLPEFLLRLIMWLLIHTIYRVEASGLEHVPEKGPAVIVCNHVTYMDALVIAARVRRPIRFVMHKFIFEIPVLGAVFRLAKAIPIASAKKDPAALASAMDQVASELADGRLVGIFPEGTLTRDGGIHEFRAGVERIVERTPAPVVPMALQGFWGSFFSHSGGPPMAHRPRLGRARIGLRVDAPVPPDQVSAEDLQRRVIELRGDQA
jgi:1-acyl-sn-glycerol-3-phosphate acyltransferase